jgi:hypothetical protein
MAGLMGNELGRIWKKTVLSNTLSLHLPEGQENHKSPPEKPVSQSRFKPNTS